MVAEAEATRAEGGGVRCLEVGKCLSKSIKWNRFCNLSLLPVWGVVVGYIPCDPLLEVNQPRSPMTPLPASPAYDSQCHTVEPGCGRNFVCKLDPSPVIHFVHESLTRSDLKHDPA